MEKSWDVVSDRLQHGDWIYDQKAGELRRKPVSLRDAAKVANDTALLRERMDMNENFTVAADQIEDKLTKLAKAFSDLSKGKLEAPQAEDIAFVEEVPDAVDDRGET
jgi:TRAP-type mannitol/chloroaromatic compound transport system substrate-binding protein